MAAVLFGAAQAGIMLLPIMLFHQMQLMACAFLARRYAQSDMEPALVPAE
jgi:sodium/bile acid cotransporter 7